MPRDGNEFMAIWAGAMAEQAVQLGATVKGYCERDGYTGLTVRQIFKDYGEYDPKEWRTHDGVYYFHTDDLTKCPECGGYIVPGEPTYRDEIDEENRDVHAACRDEWKETLREPSDLAQHGYQRV